jgi:diacylglycerol O-acyltransferase
MAKSLSGLDASFLYLETPEQPMHVASLCIYEVPPELKHDFDAEVVAHLKRRLHLAPIFTNVLAHEKYGLGHPHWEHVDEVDFDYHVQHIKIPKPGSMRQLEAAVAKEHARLLDRSQPLWQFTIFSGLKAGEIGFYGKVHHAALDGKGGMVLANSILDLSSTPREVPPAVARAAPPKTSMKIGEMIGAAFSNSLAQYAKIAKSLPSLAGAVAQAASPMLKKAMSNRKVPFNFAPRTPFNVNISAKRNFATATLSFAETRAAAKVLGGSVNDGVLFVCASALRTYLKSHNALPKKTLVAAMPVSLREESNKELNNQASMVLAELGTNHGDAAKRWTAILTSTNKIKESLKSLKSVLPTDYPGLLAPLMVSRLNAAVASTKLLERLPPVANLAISNVPGPQVPLYLAGAQMKTFYPVSIITHGLALNITVQTYCGRIDFGIIACKEAVPDLHDFASAIAGGFDELVALAEAKVALEKERGEVLEIAVNAPLPVAKAAPKSKAKPNTKTSAKASPKTVPKAKAKTAAKPKPAIKPTSKKPSAKKSRSV